MVVTVIRINDFGLRGVMPDPKGDLNLKKISDNKITGISIVSICIIISISSKCHIQNAYHYGRMICILEVTNRLTTAYMQSGFLVCSMSIVLINDIFRLDLSDFIQTMSTTTSKSTRFEMAFIYFKNQYSDGLYCSLYWYFVFHWVFLLCLSE